MFTGLVDHCGRVQSIEGINQGVRLVIETAFDEIQVGESIAVDGVCVTALQSQAHHLCCDLSPETLNLTNLNHLRTGQRVNLEKALRLDSRVGGHIVTGHVDGMCQLSAIKAMDDYTKLQLSGFQPQDMAYMMRKGAITLQGISLTVNEVDANSLSVMIIPHTMKVTNLSDLKIGNMLNFEYDYLARVWVRQYELNHKSCLEVQI